MNPILIVTNRRDLTADFLILELQRRGLPYVRVNTEDMPQHLHLTYDPTRRLLDPVLEGTLQRIPLQEIRSVWYRRPWPPCVSSRMDQGERRLAIAETSAAMEGLWQILDCYWVSKPSALREAESKPLQLAVAQQLGFTIPATLVTNCEASARDFLVRFPEAVCKPLRTGRIENTDDTCKLIYTHLLTYDDRLGIEDVSHTPTLLQEYIPKRSDIRVTVIANAVFAVEIASQEHPTTSTDWRRGNPMLLCHSVHQMPASLESMCVRYVRTLGLQFGAIDLILRPDGGYTFLEVNPNGQWAWLQQILPELPLRETLAEVLASGGRNREYET